MSTTHRSSQRGVFHLIALIPLSLFFVLGATDIRSWGLLAGVALLSTVTRFSQRQWLGLLSLVVSGLLAYAIGYRIDFVTHPEGGFFYPATWGWLLTLGWIVAVSHGLFAVGQLDPTGRLLTKILFVAGSALLFISAWQQQLFGFTALLLILGATVWLRAQAVPVERWSRAMGYCFALSAIAGLLKTTASVALLTPLVVLGVPFTGTLSIVYSHRLNLSWLDSLKIGRSATLLLLYMISALASVLAFLATRLSSELVFGLLVFAVLCVGVIFWVALHPERFGATTFSKKMLHQNVPLERSVATVKKIFLFGTPLDRVSLDEAIQRLEDLIARGRGAIVCTPDTTALMRARRDRRLRAVYERAAVVTPDGAGLVWAARLLGVPLHERVSGIDLLERFFARSKSVKIFLLGAAPGRAEQAAARLCEKYPHLQIVGTHQGYFRAVENDSLLETIRQAQPDIVLVGLGVPRQELWMLENRAQLDVPVLMGVGGCFDVWSGRLRRAPERWRKLGLEWAYRVVQEPRRIARVRVIPLFIAQVYLLKAVRALIE